MTRRLRAQLMRGAALLAVCSLASSGALFGDRPSGAPAVAAPLASCGAATGGATDASQYTLRVEGDPTALLTGTRSNRVIVVVSGALTKTSNPGSCALLALDPHSGQVERVRSVQHVRVAALDPRTGGLALGVWRTGARSSKVVLVNQTTLASLTSIALSGIVHTLQVFDRGAELLVSTTSGCPALTAGCTWHTYLLAGTPLRVRRSFALGPVWAIDQGRGRAYLADHGTLTALSLPAGRRIWRTRIAPCAVGQVDVVASTGDLWASGYTPSSGDETMGSGTPPIGTAHFCLIDGAGGRIRRVIDVANATGASITALDNPRNLIVISIERDEGGGYEILNARDGTVVRSVANFMPPVAVGMTTGIIYYVSQQDALGFGHSTISRLDPTDWRTAAIAHVGPVGAMAAAPSSGHLFVASTAQPGTGAITMVCPSTSCSG